MNIHWTWTKRSPTHRDPAYNDSHNNSQQLCHDNSSSSSSNCISVATHNSNFNSTDSRSCDYNSHAKLNRKVLSWDTKTVSDGANDNGPRLRVSNVRSRTTITVLCKVCHHVWLKPQWTHWWAQAVYTSAWSTVTLLSHHNPDMPAKKHMYKNVPFSAVHFLFESSDVPMCKAGLPWSTAILTAKCHKHQHLWSYNRMALHKFDYCCY